jgi:hypothetical protein
VETVHFHPHKPDVPGPNEGNRSHGGFGSLLPGMPRRRGRPYSAPTGDALCANDLAVPKLTYHMTYGEVHNDCINAVEFSRYEEPRTSFCGLGARRSEKCVKSLQYMCNDNHVLVVSYSMENCRGEKVHSDEFHYVFFAHMRSCFSDPHGCLGRIGTLDSDGLHRARCDMNMHAGQSWNLVPFRMPHDGGGQCIENPLNSDSHSTDLIYTQADLERARQQCFQSMHNTTQRVMETRLQEQASEYGEVLDAKDSQIGDLTGLVESESDHAKLEQYATELRTRRDALRSRVATSREKRDDLLHQLNRAGDKTDVSSIQKSLGVESAGLHKAEAELSDLERLLAVSEDIISKNEEVIKDKEKIADLESQVQKAPAASDVISKNEEAMKDKQRIADLESRVRNAWMVTTALFLTLSVGAGIQLYTARRKFVKFVDDTERTDADQAGPDAEEVGIRA